MATLITMSVREYWELRKRVNPELVKTPKISVLVEDDIADEILSALDEIRENQ